jgi:hypothetical protein
VVSQLRLDGNIVPPASLRYASFGPGDSFESGAPQQKSEDRENQSPQGDGISEGSASGEVKRLQRAAYATGVFTIGLLFLVGSIIWHTDDKRRKWELLTGALGVLGIVAIWLGCLMPG